MNTILESELGVPKTLQQAVIFHADEQNCLDLVVVARWSNGVCCPRCGDLNVKLIEHRTRKLQRTIWKCYGCKRQFSAKVGTVFEDSPLPLSTWLVAMWLFADAKNGISSCELSRSLGVTQKTAWFMLHRLREAVATGTILTRWCFDSSTATERIGIGSSPPCQWCRASG